MVPHDRRFEREPGDGIGVIDVEDDPPAVSEAREVDDTKHSGCGLGFELAPLMAILIAQHRRRRKANK